MTDEQIVKALEWCNSLSKRCGDGCPYYNVPYKNGLRCSEMMLNDTLDLIKRQQAEIERLKPFEKKVLEPIIEKFQITDCPFSPFDEYCTGHCVNCENRLECVECSKRLKMQGAKDLAKELKKHMCNYDIDNYHSFRAIEEDIIDDILEEMEKGK